MQPMALANQPSPFIYNPNVLSALLVEHQLSHLGTHSVSVSSSDRPERLSHIIKSRCVSLSATPEARVPHKQLSDHHQLVVALYITALLLLLSVTDGPREGDRGCRRATRNK